MRGRGAWFVACGRERGPEDQIPEGWRDAVYTRDVIGHQREQVLPYAHLVACTKCTPLTMVFTLSNTIFRTCRPIYSRQLRNINISRRALSTQSCEWMQSSSYQAYLLTYVNERQSLLQNPPKSVLLVNKMRTKPVVEAIDTLLRFYPDFCSFRGVLIWLIVSFGNNILMWKFTMRIDWIFLMV